MVGGSFIKDLLQWPQSKKIKIFSSIAGLLSIPLVIFILGLCFALDIGPSQLNILIYSTSTISEPFISSSATINTTSSNSSSSQSPPSSLSSSPPNSLLSASSSNLSNLIISSPSHPPSLPLLPPPYVSIPPASPPKSAVVQRPQQFDQELGSINSSCDIFYGRWVYDESMEPYYPVNSCPYVTESFNCHNNGRKDTNYLKYRWKPYDCDIPTLDGATLLKLLTGKKVLLVGDSMNRSMWVSLVCLLWQSLAEKPQIDNLRRRRAFSVKEYNCTMEFTPAVFLAKRERKAGVNETLRLDEFEESPTTNYKDYDIIVFNTGHWWTENKVNNGKNFFKEGDHIYASLDLAKACKKALRTWGKWVDNHINSKRTKVFFSGYSAAHFRGGQWNSGGTCDGETEPIMNDAQVGEYHWTMNILESQLKRMKTPVYYLNITRLTDFRKDAHLSVFRFSSRRNVTAEQRKIQDCSHWCIPGVPDEWNHLLYVALLSQRQGSKN